jgi:predicted transcriptional regulator
MSSRDFAAEIRQELEKIEGELLPLQQEQKRLRGALQSLESHDSQAGGRTRRSAEETRSAVLEAVREKPGIRGQEIAQVVGITPSYAYNILREMDEVEGSRSDGYSISSEGRGGASAGESTQQ